MDHPTCGVVVEKNGDTEKRCEEPAVDLVSVVDPYTRSRVLAVLLVCYTHSKELDKGRNLVFVAEDKQGNLTERISVQYSITEESDNESNDDAPRR